MKIGFFDGVTGEQIERDATAEEIAEREAEIARMAAEKQAKRDAVENPWRIKVAAYEKLGLTADEIEALAPTPEWLKS